MNRNLTYLVAASVFVSACGDDGNDMDGSSVEPHRFTISIENVAPQRPFTSAGVFDTPRFGARPGNPREELRVHDPRWPHTEVVVRDDAGGNQRPVLRPRR